MIDLHAHTTASDGERTPGELVDLAVDAGVRTLAITDHDTLAGIPAALERARARGLRLIPGIEVSAFIGSKEVHLLGHFVDPAAPGLGGLSGRMRQARDVRMTAMIERLNDLNIPVRREHVEALAAGAPLGRPHLARALVELRHCVDVKDAFDRYLGAGKPAFVERYRLLAAEAIALIHAAGGTATLAHPAVSRVEPREVEALKAAGLDGLEVDHADQDSSEKRSLLKLAEQLDLVPTAGSDFHGQLTYAKRRLGSTSMSASDLDRLEARAGRASTPTVA